MKKHRPRGGSPYVTHTRGLVTHQSSGLPLCMAEQDIVCRKHDYKTIIALFLALVIPDLWEIMPESGKNMAITVPALVTFWNH